MDWTDHIIALLVTAVFAAGLGFGYLVAKIQNRNKDV